MPMKTGFDMASSTQASGTPSSAKKQALIAAAEWYSLLCSGSARAQDEQRLRAWLALDEVNRWAWDRVGQLQKKLGRLPGNLAQETFIRAEKHLHVSRRSVLKGLVLLAGTGSLTWVAYRHGPLESLFADQYTSVGEIKSLLLDDGSTLIMNTASAVDVRFSVTERRLVLKQGEIMVETAKDSLSPAGRPVSRPFIVETPSGQIRALGTRFSVRYLDNAENTTRVNVYQHSVEVTAQDGTQHNCNAGHRLDFTDRQVSPAVHGAENDAWVRRQLVINDMRLDDFVRELGRYRTGLLRCDPAVAHFRISGAFRTDDTDQALRAIEKSFPVKVTYRTRYWVHISR